MFLKKIPENLDRILVKKSIKNCSGKKGIEREKCIVRSFTELCTEYVEVANKFKLNELNEFEYEFVKVLYDTGKLKRSLAHIHKSTIIIKKLSREHLRKISTAEEYAQAKRFATEFLGRACSVIKKMRGSIKNYNEFAATVREIPSLKKMPTILIAGVPNSGKTTLLNELAGTKAKVASYAFTTTSLNIGYFNTKRNEIQLIDTPGLLDRSFEEMNRIEQKAVVALKCIANTIFFVLDASETSAPIGIQRRLLERILGLGKPVIVVISKTDIASNSGIKEAASVSSKLGLKFIEKSGQWIEKLSELVDRIIST